MSIRRNNPKQKPKGARNIKTGGVRNRSYKRLKSTSFFENMGCIWSCTPLNHCSLCNCKESRESGFINNTCRPYSLAVQSRQSSTTQYYGTTSRSVNTSIPNENRSYVRVLPQPKPKTTSDEPQFGKYNCKTCGRYWTSLRSWSTKYQLCKSCKNPVYPHKLRPLLASDYTSTLEDSKEHERELCQMCKHLGYACKDYGKNVKRR